jgi:hypothetical protein
VFIFVSGEREEAIFLQVFFVFIFVSGEREEAIFLQRGSQKRRPHS